MMSSSKCLLMAALMSLLLLHLCSQSEAMAFDCCLRYTRRVLRTRNIRGFSRQYANETCDIDAVVFYTKNGWAVCADPTKKWVTHAIFVLSQNENSLKM
ncbi:C-C motif chemokine 20 [Phyllostomus hastatus]|uniref:C-C motif chemokine 20 n=1 Tax=Phyllostomus hastatus TaxID=9423 RepID=UPI001E685177|nr:C-C motif chemokine 20 [Phyllostomus hastatus]